MTVPEPVRNELFDLLWSINEGSSSPDDVARLEELVDRHQEAGALYAQYSAMCGLLSWERKKTPSVQSVHDGAFAATDDNVAVIDDDSYAVDEPSFVPSSLSPLPSPLSPSFVGGPVFSYMVATVVLCLMLLGAWAYKISHNSDLDYVDNIRRSTTSRPEKLVFVGKITGMKDCRWSDPNTQTLLGASVALNREYALTSGLLEITYQSGARVILEGPCTYKVDSDTGGLLTRGKLTARIEHQGLAASAASAKPQAVFTVQTPTAIVTDLGTEFGVEVDEKGDTISYVFQGSISVQGLAASVASGATKKVLHENESIRVSRVRATYQDSSSVEQVRFTHPTNTPLFTRQMPPRQTAKGAMPVKDSADFAWKYEMDVDPATQDLDANPGPDWRLHRGALQVGGDGTVTLAYLGDHSGCLISAGQGDSEHSPTHVWNNIDDDTGYTVELRVKVAGTVEWHGHDLGLYFLTADSMAEDSSIVVITNKSTLWDIWSKYLIDNNRNDDDFHVFRIAQEPNSGKYHVWRDGVLIRLSEGFKPSDFKRVQIGDMGARGGPNVIDYIRLAPGAYAPPRRMRNNTQPTKPEDRKEVRAGNE